MTYPGRRAICGAIAALAIWGGVAAPAMAKLPPPVGELGARSIRFPGNPPIRVRLPKGANYIGGERFELLDIADCELHLFVEAGSDRVVHRYYWVQRERYLPDRPDLTHAYGPADQDRRERHWGLDLWVRAGLGKSDAATELKEPKSDSAHIRQLLQRSGYVLPVEMMNVRFVRLLDEKNGDGHGREELMVIYAEDMESNNLRVDDLMAGATPGPRWTAISAALIQRAEQRITVQIGRR